MLHGALAALRSIQAKSFSRHRAIPGLAEGSRVCRERKKLVFNLLWEQVIEPLITKFENPTPESIKKQDDT